MGLLIESCQKQINKCNKEESSNQNNLENAAETAGKDLPFIPNSEIPLIIENDFKPRIEENIEDAPCPKCEKIDPLLTEHEKNPFKIYKELENIGSGQYGNVKKVCLINNKDVIRAVKIISKIYISEELDNLGLLNEIQLLKKLNHPNILRLFDYYIDKENIYLIYDFCSHGNLLNYIKKYGKMNQLLVKYIMNKILKAVSYLHSKQIIHGNIKLENILLKQNDNNYIPYKKNTQNQILNYDIKISDFGYDEFLTNKQTQTENSKIEYVYLSPDTVNNLYDEKSDEWACGVIMYILLTGKAPFTGETEQEIYENIKLCKYNINNLKNVTDKCIDLVKKLLEPNYSKRIKANEALSHKFFDEVFDKNIFITEYKDLNILTNFLNFKKPPSKFHYDVMAAMSKLFITEQENIKLKKIFRYLDETKEEKISAKHVYNCLIDNNMECSENEFNEIFKMVDANDNGNIEYEEFVIACCDKDSLYALSNIKAIFEKIKDNNEDKEYITGDDIKKFFFHDKNIDENDFIKYLEEFGMERNGKLKFKGFFDIIRNWKNINENPIDALKRAKPKAKKKSTTFGRISIIEENP